MEDIKFLNGNKYRLDGCYIELTSRCNLRCKHCYNDSGELKEEISEQAFQNILNCYDRDIEPYISFSGGEPLLHPPSHRSPLIRSVRLPQNRNSVFLS